MSELEDFLRGAAQLRKPRRAEPAQPTPAADAPPASLAEQPSLRSRSQKRRRARGDQLSTDHAANQTEATAARVHEKFDHPLGRLEQAEVEAAEGLTPAQEIALLLSRPQSVRQAIILAEVLRSPVERWERSW